MKIVIHILFIFNLIIYKYKNIIFNYLITYL